MRIEQQKKFADFQYVRPDFEKFEQEFTELLQKFSLSATAAEQSERFLEILELRKQYETTESLALIRHTLDTTDPFYQEEKAFFNKTNPLYDGLKSKFYSLLLDSPYKAELQEEYGSQLFAVAESNSKTFSPAVIDLLTEENELENEYEKLIASAKIDFDGQERNLTQLKKYLTIGDREKRKAAAKAIYHFYDVNAGKIDEIFDRLVKVRTEIAQTLGYKNFIELVYLRMARTDWDADSAKSFRESVRKFVVPVVTQLVSRQRIRLGLEEMKFYDEKVHFLTGNAEPQGDAAWIIEQGDQLFSALSPETGEFYKEMVARGLFDLVDKNGKANIGYCTVIWGELAPFVFATFNGTANDIRVLNHEIGHAFQLYLTMKASLVPESQFATSEGAEIHSMSMELLVMNLAHLFFGEGAEKHNFAQMNDALIRLPWTAAVDEFQHEVYANPGLSPQERKKLWKQLEKKYLPYRDNDDCAVLNDGGAWHDILHVFRTPFYFIDYSLAQVVAFQIWKKSNEDWESAWDSYLELCRLGGSKSFKQLIAAVNLKSPFEESTVKEVMDYVVGWLDGVDDSRF